MPYVREHARQLRTALGWTNETPVIVVNPGFGWIIEALADAGVKAGLPRELALELSAQTVYGAAKMVLETHEQPGKLRDKVTSPGGTTIEGLHMLTKGKLREALMNAVEAATARSKELGK